MIPTQDAQDEVWKPVVGHEGRYSVSNLGRVRRDARGAGTTAGYVLSPTLSERQYLKVQLRHGKVGEKTTAYVHSLVAAAFIGPRPLGHEVNHRDLDKLNNRACNLEYVTRQQNVLHAFQSNPNRRRPRKVSPAEIVEVLRRVAAGESKTRVAQSLGRGPSQVRGIVAANRPAEAPGGMQE